MRDELKRLAARINSVRPKDPQQATIYNFVFGALYALARAEELGFPTHGYGPGIGMQRSREVALRAIALKNLGRVPRTGHWLAGFYFNDALIRADVCYEHVTRFFTKKKGGDIHALIKWAAASGFPKDMLEPAWRDIRDEVNNLKHNSLEFAEGPIIGHKAAVSTISSLVAAVVWVLKSDSNSKLNFC